MFESSLLVEVTATISLREAETGGNPGCTWSEGIADALMELLHLPTNPGELLFCVVIVLVIVFLVGIGAALES